MAGTDPIFGDQAELTVGGVAITIGTALNWTRAWTNKTAAATWGSNAVDKPIEYTDTITIPFVDMVGHVDFYALMAQNDGELHAIVAYPEGNTAGKMNISGSAYVVVDGLQGGLDAAYGGTLTLNVSGGLTFSPNIVLATQAVGTVAAGGAGSGLATLAASGGTTTYTYALVTQLPKGLTMTSGGVFGGTNDAAQTAGTYTFTVRVTDSAATPVVKDFVCTLISS